MLANQNHCSGKASLEIIWPNSLLKAGSTSTSYSAMTTRIVNILFQSSFTWVTQRLFDQLADLGPFPQLFSDSKIPF